MGALELLDDWPVPTVAAAVVTASRIEAAYGDASHRFRLASVTKPLVARAAQIAIEEGAVDLETEAGPPGSTIRHLLAHTSGLAMTEDGQAGAKRPGDEWAVIARPGARRIYSNVGFRVLAEAVQNASGMDFGTYLAEGVFEPLGMGHSTLDGGAATAGYGATSTVADLAAFAGELLAPQLVSAEMHADATSVQFPGLNGVLPGYGAQKPNDWGLGFELRSQKSPHWTGASNSPRTFGHFGQSGTFLWVDPDAQLALVVLTDRDFDEWAKPLWPALSDEVLREFGAH